MNVLTAELCILDSSEEEEDSDASISESEISQMRRETITTQNQTAEGTSDLADVTNFVDSIENIIFDDYPDFVENIADDCPDLVENIIVADTNNPNLVVNIVADSNPDLVENVANDDADLIESIVDSNPDLVADDTNELNQIQNIVPTTSTARKRGRPRTRGGTNKNNIQLRQGRSPIPVSVSNNPSNSANVGSKRVRTPTRRTTNLNTRNIQCGQGQLPTLNTIPVPAPNNPSARVNVKRKRGRPCTQVQPPTANTAPAPKKLAVAPVNIGLPDADDGWEMVLKKPRLLKFTGTEKFNYVNKPANEVEYFKLLFTDEMMDKIIEFTNIKGLQLSNVKRPHPRRASMRDWKPIDKEEFQKFLSLCLLMGNISMPSMKHYWKQKSGLYYHPLFGKIMSRNRFETILRVLRFYDPNDFTGRNIPAKGKVEYILIEFVKNFKKAYYPGKHLSLDEALLGFKGRLSYKQYIPLKRSRFGIKLYELSSSTGYILDIVMYTGKGTMNNKKHGHAYAVVRKLMKPYQKRGHALYLDNYYTSIALAETLLKQGVSITGTLRSNRKGIPEIFQKSKLKKGESFFLRRNDVLIQKWKDKRDILMISTRHNGEFEEVKPQVGASKLKPKAIAEYNRYMGGIDKADQIMSYYTSPRKTCRWQLKVFFHLIDISLWNATYLYNFEETKKTTYLTFREKIISSFLGLTDAPTPAGTPRSSSGSQLHLPVALRPGVRLRCRYCSMNGKRASSYFKCNTCIEPKTMKPIGLCRGFCFIKFHNEKLHQKFQK